MDIHIEKEGFYSYNLTIQKKEQMHIHIDKHINASMMLSYHGIEASVHVFLHLEEGSTLTFMIKNEITSKLTMDMQADVYRDASLTLALCELDDAATTANVQIALKQEGAYAKLRSACIVTAKKAFAFDCVHETAHTTGLVENYAVVRENGNYYMKTVGKIKKGAYESVSHQTSRVLTMSHKHTSEVEPILLIDENDVKASHATTVGQPDENQLYYLQTRGLSRQQALGLLIVSYIMPITEIFKDEDAIQKLKKEIEMKVGLHA